MLKLYELCNVDTIYIISKGNARASLEVERAKERLYNLYNLCIVI